MRLTAIPDRVRQLGQAHAAGVGGELVEVDLGGLETGQSRLNVQRLLNVLAIEGPCEPILTVAFRGHVYLLDGNHRAWAALVRGERVILSRHLEVKE